MNDDAFPTEDTTEELSAIYMAGAMTVDEQAKFEARLETDAELRSALQSMDEAGQALLAQVDPIQPNPEIRQTLLDRIAKEDTINEPSIIIHRADSDDWQPTGIPGSTIRILHADIKRRRMTCLMRLEPGATYPSHEHDQPEECLMIEGDLNFGDYTLYPGDYLRVEAGTEHNVATTKQGCLCLITAALPDSLVA